MPLRELSLLTFIRHLMATDPFSHEIPHATFCETMAKDYCSQGLSFPVLLHLAEVIRIWRDILSCSTFHSLTSKIAACNASQNLIIYGRCCAFVFPAREGHFLKFRPHFWWYLILRLNSLRQHHRHHHEQRQHRKQMQHQCPRFLPPRLLSSLRNHLHH